VPRVYARPAASGVPQRAREPIEDRWERMITGTPWIASCTVTVDADDVETCSGPTRATHSPTRLSETTAHVSSSRTFASTSMRTTASSST